MVGARRAWLALALAVATLVPAACASGDHSPSRRGTQARIVRAAVGWRAASWVELSDGRTVVSADAGQTWRELAPPRPPANGASVLASGAAVTVVAVSGRTLTVQRSTDHGASWQIATHRLREPARTADVAASADGRELAVAVAAPGSAGASGGYGQVLVGPADGRLVARPAPGAAGVVWSGDRLLVPGGPARSRLYLSADGGRNWSPRAVGGPVAPDHDVPAGAPVLGLAGASGAAAIVTVTTRHDVRVYRTTDGTRYAPVGTVRFDAAIGPGVGAVASVYGPHGVVVADPSSTRMYALIGTTENSLAGSGLPGPVDSLRFQDAEHGLAEVTVRQCTHGKRGCTEDLRVYRTSDGGRSWTRIAPAP